MWYLSTSILALKVVVKALSASDASFLFADRHYTRTHTLLLLFSYLANNCNLFKFIYILVLPRYAANLDSCAYFNTSFFNILSFARYIRFLMVIIPSSSIQKGFSTLDSTLFLILIALTSSCWAYNTLSQNIDYTFNWAIKESSSLTSILMLIFLNSSHCFLSQTSCSFDTVLYLWLRASTTTFALPEWY